MAYDRYDTRDLPHDERSGWRGERENRGWGRDGGRGYSGREDRGFFERVGEEVRSWFGDEDDDRGSSERSPGFRRESASRREPIHERDEDRGRFWRDRTWDRGDFEQDDDRFRPSGWGSRERDFGRDRERGMGREPERGYRPMTGDYGRSEGFFGSGGPARGRFERDFDDRSGYGRSQSPYGRDEYRRTAYAGSPDRSGDFDPHYRSWRDRHVSELDRDYDEYRREHQSRFEDDFAGWRERRMQKRGLLGQIREHMEVVGNDGEHVGTIDRVAGDRIILTKSDPESGGVHRSLSCSDIDRVEGDRVILDCSSTEARVRWRDESRSRALFEREDQGEMGPRMLDRSFEGTYR